MSNIIDQAASELERLAVAIESGWDGEQTFLEVWGWNCPPITKRDLARSIRFQKDSILSIDKKKFDKNLDAQLAQISPRVQMYITQVLPNLWGGNNPACVGVLQSLLEWIKASVGPYIDLKPDWESIESQKLLPKSLAVRLRAMEANLATLGARSEGLDAKIQVIENAYAAAENLPTDLESLNEARQEISALRAAAGADASKIQAISEEVPKILILINDKKAEAIELVENCEDAYSAATTKGLGEAFSIKAKELSNSMWIWVAGLFLSLLAGYAIGHDRIDDLQTLLNNKEATTASIVVNLVLTLFSIAAPVWFAWISTKQIGQRFRLSEDYGFKASVAKAYEGYRREAKRLDPSFASRLFGTALSRIEEAPLRFVENDNHGSPFHEWTSRFSDIKTPFGSLSTKKTNQEVTTLSPSSNNLASHANGSEVTEV